MCSFLTTGHANERSIASVGDDADVFVDGQRLGLRSARCELKTSEEINADVSGIGPEDVNNDSKIGGVYGEEQTKREGGDYDNQDDHYNPLTAVVRGAPGNTLEQKSQAKIGAASGEGNRERSKLKLVYLKDFLIVLLHLLY